jgi:hypothetical protein
MLPANWNLLEFTTFCLQQRIHGRKQNHPYALSPAFFLTPCLPFSSHYDTDKLRYWLEVSIDLVVRSILALYSGSPFEGFWAMRPANLTEGFRIFLHSTRKLLGYYYRIDDECFVLITLNRLMWSTKTRKHRSKKLNTANYQARQRHLCEDVDSRFHRRFLIILKKYVLIN